MTQRNCKEFSAVREPSHFNQAGSFLFSQPAEVDHWCQSVQFGDLPPTPPDTISECANSDCQDMNQPWTQSLTEDQWIGNQATDNSTMQSSARAWRSHDGVLTAQDLSALNASTWLNTSHGFVDYGVSPVLSYESQNSHSLATLSEPDVAVLPPSLDLSFVSEPWNAIYPEVSAMSQPITGNGFVSSPCEVSSQVKVETASTAPQSVFPDEHRPVIFHQDVKPTCSDQVMPCGLTVTSRRQLLHRTEGYDAVPSQQAPIQERMFRPPMPKPMDSQSSVGTVSTSSYQRTGKPVVQPISPGRTSALCVSPVPSYVPGPMFVKPTSGHGNATHSHREASISYASEPTAEDFGAYFDMDQAAPAMTSGATSYMAGYSREGAGIPNPVHLEPQYNQVKQDQDTNNMSYQGSTASTTSDIDEGRHRNHPLYSEGPRADGLYHCPFQSDPGCQHKPTKLKCNYDKFIDSHLKPFRCKFESCSKQEFSSTACLLRHEREAHGMHGHGEKPHLCFYPGCERGIPGNGFPRRYNLFDHMKRVHDHKDDGMTLSRSPGGESQGQKKASRKRKATDPHDAEPVSQRPKTESMPQQHQQPVAMITMPQAQVGYYDVPVQYQPVTEPFHRAQHKQRLLYSQWANQRELLARQMDFVQSPDDENNLIRLSQNIDELRRISQEARRG